METVSILGGGPAGLSAAYFLKINNMPFHLYESSNAVGGNCKTLSFDKCKYDTGAHRFHSKNSIATKVIKDLIKNDLAIVNAPSKIFFNSKMINFPLEPKSLLVDFNFYETIKIIIENTCNMFKKSNNTLSFKNSAYAKYGKTVSDKFLINYTEKLWGANSDLLHREVTGDRFNNLTPISILKNIINSKGSSAKHLEGDFLYPKKGYGQIFYELGKLVQDRTSINSKVERIYVSNNAIQQIRLSNGNILKTANVISTLPLNILVKIFQPNLPNKVIEMGNKLKFRDLRLAIFTLKCDFFSKNASLYFPEKTIPFTRIYEPKNRSIEMAPEGKTCIVVETPYSPDDDVGSMNDKEFLEKVQEHLVKNNIVNNKLFLKSSSMTMPNAYPVITKESKVLIEKINQYLRQFKNLKIIGRNAQFKYLHTHHLIKDAYYAIKDLQ